MAGTWDVAITVRDLATKEASVVATRTDSGDASVQVIHISSALLATAAQKLGVLDAIWAEHLRRTTHDASIAAVVDGMEAQAKTALEGKET